MKKPTRSILIHPFLFTTYAVLAPLANNIGTVGFQAIKSLLVTLAAVVVLSLLFRLLFKNQEKSSLLLTGLIIGFFSFGTLEQALNALHPNWAGTPYLAVLILLGLLAVWAAAIFRWIQREAVFTSYFNLLGLILLAFPLFTIFTYRTQSSKYDQAAAAYQQELLTQNHLETIPVEQAAANQPRRDIYYIILDSYTRGDVLANLYGYDNSEFIRQLQQRGFYVAEESNANYSHTIYSMASALNMAQVNTAPEYLRSRWKMNTTAKSPIQGTVTVLMQNNRVMSFLEEQGYTTVAYDFGYIKITSADRIEKSPNISEFDPSAAFEIMLADTTLGKLLWNAPGKENQVLKSTFDSHRNRILFTLSDLPNYTKKEGDFFIYAHVMAPHSPYVFGPNGEERMGVTHFTLENEDAQGWSFEMYRDQVIYVNQLVLNTVDQILANSTVPPIIIIQGDHSTNSRLFTETSIQDQMLVSFPILNAYYLPGVEASTTLYPTITPVNTFREVLNSYFGTRLDLLPDVSYSLVDENGKLQFVDICRKYKYCTESNQE